MKPTTMRTPKQKIIVFQEADGWHWNVKEVANATGFLDARGPAYPTQAAAMKAARAHLFD